MNQIVRIPICALTSRLAAPQHFIKFPGFRRLVSTAVNTTPKAKAPVDVPSYANKYVGRWLLCTSGMVVGAVVLGKKYSVISYVISSIIMIGIHILQFPSLRPFVPA
jgi:hypothetical protein